MHIELTQPELERFIQEQVKQGRFSSAEEVVHGALELLRANKPLPAGELEELRAAIAIGIEQADRGDLAPFDPEQSLAEVERRIAAERAKG